MIPDGFRKLEVGEVIQVGDQYRSSSGSWTSADTFAGYTALSNGVFWIRPIDGGKDADSFKNLEPRGNA
jgi:hypothetical protein